MKIGKPPKLYRWKTSWFKPAISAMNLHEAKSVDHQAAARVIAGVVYSKVGPGRTEGDVPIHLVKLAGDRKHEFWAQKVADQRESSYFRVSLGW